MMNILQAMQQLKFNDFQAEFHEIHTQLSPAVDRVLQSGLFLLGNETIHFEEELAHLMQQSHAVAVANGTEALAIALAVSGVKAGDEVVVPALTAYPTVIAIEMLHAIPVVCEVSLETGLMDPTQVEHAITPKTKAIVPVHLYGQVCPMEEIAVIARSHSVPIVEDCAQSILSQRNNQLAGSWSLASAFSFYPSKNLGAYGDAGAVLMTSQEHYQRAKKLRQYGQSDRYAHDEFGFNSRIDELQAAILRIKIPKARKWIERRRAIATYYQTHLKIGFPLQADPLNYHTYHLYVIRVKNRYRFMTFCQNHQIPTIIHYPKTVYQQLAFRGKVPRQCPKAETLVEEIVSLPIHPYLSDEQVAYMCQTLNQFHE